MGDRRGAQLLFEAVFLIALAAALALAHLRAIEIAGGMLLGWLVVAALEWASWRSKPHYGSGVPPRYYVPSVNLPPAQPLEQVAVGYPEAARDEAPTWIASAELRSEVLGEWPVTMPAAPAPKPEPGDEVDDEEDEEPEFVAAGAADADPWTVAELPAEPAAGRAPAAANGGPVARYHPEPLADPVPRKRFGRRSLSEEEAPIEVPARPSGVRPLPGAAQRKD
jgi:hypothetical protein